MTSLSIIVEMENLTKSDRRRADRLFSWLANQSVTFELIVLYDPEDVPAGEVEGRLERAGFDLGSDVTVRAAPGKRYYELKNLGATLASGDLVLFLDCDLEPEPGLLEATLESFEDPAVEVVAASPYVHPCETLFQKAFALFWLFPLRSDDGPLQPILEYAANSVAFRRQLFLRFPFPDSPCYRRQCAMQADELLRAGYTLWGNPRAGVRHPPPLNWRAAIARALREGRDRYFDRVTQGIKRPPSPVKGALGMRRSVRDLGARIRAHAARVGLTDREIPLALGMAAAYEVAVRAGFIATSIDRRLVPDR